MASGSVWGIDIGKSSLKAVRMRKVKEELEIQALHYQEYEPNDDGSISPGEPSRALDAFIAEYPQVKKERALVALPGHNAFSRFTKLPGAFDSAQIAQMVKFEAQQQIPFPIADVNWDYAEVQREYEEGEDVEVGLFAIKKEIVYAYLADLQLAGVDPDVLTIGPLATYNFIRCDVDVPADQATVVLDMGYDHTDLIIVDGERYWTRNLPLNGNDLTKAIQTKFGIPYAEAERRKREAAQSKDAPKLYAATQTVLRDFVGELHRSIGFYKAQNKQRNVQVGQMLLLGNGSKLPNVRPFFQKEFGFPVEQVKRLNRLVLEGDIDVEVLKEQLPSFAVAFGLAIQGVDEGTNKINLLPEEVRQKKALERKKPLAAVAVALAFVLVGIMFFMKRSALEKIDGVLADAKKQVEVLDKDRQSVNAKKELPAEVEKRLDALAAATLRRNLTIEVLNKLAPFLPKKNEDLAVVSPAQQKILDQKPHLIPGIEGEFEAAQSSLNDSKIWLLELKVAPLEAATPTEGEKGEKKAGPAGVRATLFVARKFAVNASGVEDENATLEALKQNLLKPMQEGPLKSARFEGKGVAIYGLEKDATQQATSGGGFGASAAGPRQKFYRVAIVIDYQG